MRWDQSPECRAIIDRTERSIAEWKANRAQHREADIRVNHIWHGQNLEMLAQCVEYARHDMINECFLLGDCFAREESARLQNKLEIMQLYNIECLPPSPHTAREQELWRELKEIDGKRQQAMLDALDNVLKQPCSQCKKAIHNGWHYGYHTETNLGWRQTDDTPRFLQMPKYCEACKNRCEQFDKEADAIIAIANGRNFEQVRPLIAAYLYDRFKEALKLDEEEAGQPENPAPEDEGIFPW